jgi:hypothetical protein
MNKSKSNKTTKTQISEKLAEIGLTLEEARQWLKGDLAFDDQAYCTPQNTEGCFKDKQDCCMMQNTGKNCCMASNPWDCAYDAAEEQPEELSNVVFAAGKTAEASQVYVGNIPVEGIIRAKLEYDTELGIPTLQLDILNPKIALACCYRK